MRYDIGTSYLALYKRASRVLNLFRDLRGAILFRILRNLCVVLKPKITLTYLNTAKADGIGAQVQRILAIASLSKNLNLGYVHTGIASVAVHPLDPYQSESELKAFLIELNHLFYLDSTVNKSEIHQIELSAKTLNFPGLFRIILKSATTRKRALIRIVEPYGISEHDPFKFQDISELLPNFTPILEPSNNFVIHYRRGVGGLSVQKGEKISREVESKFFSRLATEIFSKNVAAIKNFTIFTDAPSDNLEYTPPTDQGDLWENSSKFENGVMSISGLDMKEIFQNFPVEPDIHYGGDPLAAIRVMAGADFLIMSRSSFSYLSAALNKNGIIYFPSKFWHKPLKSWNIVEEDKYVS